MSTERGREAGGRLGLFGRICSGGDGDGGSGGVVVKVLVLVVVVMMMMLRSGRRARGPTTDGRSLATTGQAQHTFSRSHNPSARAGLAAPWRERIAAPLRGI